MKGYNPHNHPCDRYCGQAGYEGAELRGTKGCLRETCARYYNRCLAAVSLDAPQGCKARQKPAITKSGTDLDDCEAGTGQSMGVE